MEGMESPELKVKEQLVSAVTRWHWASVSHPRAVTAHLSLFICLPHSHSVTMNPGLPQCLQSFPGLSLSHSLSYFRASLVAQLVKKKKKKKKTACNAGNSGSIPGLGRSPGGGHANPLQYSCLENLMDRGAWRTTVHGVTKSQTQLSD